MEELIVHGQHAAIGVYRSALMVTLLARMIGGEKMLAPILDPFHGAPEAQSTEGDEYVFRVKLAADAEAASDMPLFEMDGFRLAAKHAGEIVARAVRHLGRAVEFEHIARGIV